MRSLKTMWTAAAAIAIGSVGCNDPSSTSATEPATTTSPVTNTNATVPANPSAAAAEHDTAGADPLANVANREQVQNDPNETKIDPPKPATLITGFATLVRESPRGEKVETIETAANVNEVARDGDYFLITYPDPQGSNKTFGGWVYKDSLESAEWATQASSQTNSRTVTLSNTNPAKGATKLGCAGNMAHVRTTRDFCAATCKDDTGCDAKSDQICDGLAFKVDESNNHTSSTRYCIARSSSSANGAHGTEHGSLPH